MGEESSAVPYRKLFSFADSADHCLMLVGTVSAAANGLSLPLMTVIFGALVDSFGESGDTKEALLPKVSKVSLEFLYLALGSAAAAFLQVACWTVTAERQAARIRSLYLKTILRQDIAFFDMETNTGEVIERMSGDTALIQDAMGEKVGKFIQLMATFIGSFVVAFMKGRLLTLVMISTIPALIISGAVMSFTIGRLSSRGQTAYSQAAIVVEQTIGSIRTVASFTGEKLSIEKYNKSLTKAYESGVQEGLVSGLGMGVVQFIVFSSYGLALWVGAKMIIDKGYSGGDVINVIFAVLTGSMSLGQTSPCLTAFSAGRAAAFKMFEAMRRKPEIDSYDINGKVFDDIGGEIELRDVCFSYPSRPGEQILEGFSLFVPRGTSTALVGQSGSGKSTVISLIERFYDPQSGQVLVDGVNLKEFRLKWLRQKIGLVGQEPVLFSSTIRDNIAYGKDGATSEEIRAAAKLANADKFIDKLPRGLDTVVGEHGTQLSGGQKQRVAIARAILKDPRILLLDEATSALDAESERAVQEALDRVMINRTTLVVAHRLSTVRSARTIYVMHRGKIVEQGPHSELIKDPRGAYRKLIRLQEQDGANELVTSSGGHLSQRLGRGSSGKGDNSSRYSFSISLGVPNDINALEPSGTTLSPPSKVAQKVSLCELARLNKPEIPVLLLGSVAAAANGLILPVFGVLLSIIVKIFFQPPRELQRDSRLWALAFLGLGLASLLAQPARSYLFAVTGCRLIRRIRSMCFEKLVYTEVSWFDEAENSSGAIGARLSTDAASVRALVGDALGLLVQNAATTIAGLVIAFEANWQMALIVLFLLPLIGVNGYVQIKFLEGFSADAKKMYEEASRVANDAVGSMRTVASFCAEEKAMEMYRNKCRGPIKAGIKQGLVTGIGFGVSLFLLFSVYGCSFYAGARLIVAGKANFAQVFRVFFALTLAAIGVSQTWSMVPDISKTKSAVGSVFAILKRKSTIDSSEDSGIVLEGIRGDIEFRHVTFRYPTRLDVQIFRDLCLSIQAGQTVALVGESGSGKSTVISLLQRFYTAESGEITVDGVEIQRLRVRWLRQQIGVVSQEAVLFNDTLRANIAYGNHGGASEAEIVAAAEGANADSFIAGMEKGYDTVVGERGTQLSGGQKQRVAIARAILKSPKILLLDEATSALDAESERAVQEALRRLMIGRTTVAVAHRLSSVKGADVIAVVKNGVIVEKGKHEALMAIEGGVYASLVGFHSSKSNPTN